MDSNAPQRHAADYSTAECQRLTTLSVRTAQIHTAREHAAIILKDPSISTDTLKTWIFSFSVLQLCCMCYECVTKENQTTCLFLPL